MPWKDNNKIWFNPAYIHACCVELVQKKGIDQIKKERKYKYLVESYDLAIIALVIYNLNSQTHGLPLIQIPKKDPPDGYIGQESKKEFGVFDISKIELTRYDGKNGKSLLTQLKDSSKLALDFIKYSKEYVLVIKVEEGVEPEYIEVNEFLVKNKIQFSVWGLQIIETYPNTIAKLIILHPQIQIIEVNIGKVALEYKIEKIPNVQEINRVGSKERVRKESGGTIDPKYFHREFGWIVDN